MRNPWNVYLGDCAVVDTYLSTKPLTNPLWAIAHFFNCFLRAVGQPAFVNNPLLGLIIWIALFLPHWTIGVGCLLGGGVATITELILGLHPWDLVRNGVAPFNGVLVGTVTSALYPAVYSKEMFPGLWIAIVLGAVTSVFFASAFNKFLGQFNVPYLALPFNTIIVCLFLTLQPPDSAVPTCKPPVDNVTVTVMGTICDYTPGLESNGTASWCGVVRGVAVSMGQVYAINHVVGSSLINLAVLLSSPLLFLMSTVGAIVGTLLGVAVLPLADLQEVYDGVWGYNSLLAMAAVSCVFFPLTPASLVAGAVNTVATVGAQAGLRANMVKNRLPVFTIPMTLVSLVMLMASQERYGEGGPALARVGDMSYPEKQAKMAWNDRKEKANHEDGSSEERESAISKVELSKV